MSILDHFYSLNLNTNSIPLPWKYANTQLVPKKFEYFLINNCTIVLTCIFSKIFESLLNSHFLNHLKPHSTPSDYLYGFRYFSSAGEKLAFFSPIYGLLPLRTITNHVCWGLSYSESLNGYGVAFFSRSSHFLWVSSSKLVTYV